MGWRAWVRAFFFGWPKPEQPPVPPLSPGPVIDPPYRPTYRGREDWGAAALLHERVGFSRRL